jgi:hypothetical protein
MRSNKSLSKQKSAKEKASDELSQEEANVKVGFKRLAQLNKPELPAIISGVFGAAIMGLLFPIFAWRSRPSLAAFSALVGRRMGP